MTPKTKDLLNKLNELAKRGVGGEKANAQTFLNKLLQQHCLTLADLENEQPTLIYSFDWLQRDPLERNVFYLLIVANVLGKLEGSGRHHGVFQQGKSRYFEVAVTAAEKVEIEAKIAFYWPDYLNQLQDFRNAYFARNNLFTKGQFYRKDELTPEEKQRIRKANKIAEGIDRKPFHKQLKGA